MFHTVWAGHRGALPPKSTGVAALVRPSNGDAGLALTAHRANQRRAQAGWKRGHQPRAILHNILYIHVNIGKSEKKTQRCEDQIIDTSWSPQKISTTYHKPLRWQNINHPDPLRKNSDTAAHDVFVSAYNSNFSFRRRGRGCRGRNLSHHGMWSMVGHVLASGEPQICSDKRVTRETLDSHIHASEWDKISIKVLERPFRVDSTRTWPQQIMPRTGTFRQTNTWLKQ